MIQLNRDRAYYRKQRKRIIRNKSRLLKRLGGGDLYEGWTRGCPSRLAKGKIHCSCWMCRTKSYDCPSYRDVRQKLDARQQMEECLEKGGIDMKGIFGIYLISIVTESLTASSGRRSACSWTSCFLTNEDEDDSKPHTQVLNPDKRKIFPFLLSKAVHPKPHEMTSILCGFHFDYSTLASDKPSGWSITTETPACSSHYPDRSDCRAKPLPRSA